MIKVDKHIDKNIAIYALIKSNFRNKICDSSFEAQACHIPVITSNISSMPEAAGNSAIFVNPYEIKEIEEAIITLFHDQLLRERLIHNGYSNALKYTWEKSAKELHDILHNEWINTN